MGFLGLIGWARWIVEGASFVKGRKEGKEELSSNEVDAVVLFLVSLARF